jgi:hypothetical protein
MTGSEQGGHNDGLITGLLVYFDRHGILTRWYWPPGCRGRLYNLLHGHGWRIG